MTRILFVCLGNICRSPMAEFVLKDMTQKAGLAANYRIASAGTESFNIGKPVYPEAAKMLARHGIRCQGKTARQLKKGDYNAYDLLIGMDRENLQDMWYICGGDTDGKFRLLLDFTDRPGDVSDPWYTRDFAAAWRDIEDGCRGLLAWLEGRDTTA